MCVGNIPVTTFPHAPRNQPNGCSFPSSLGSGTPPPAQWGVNPGVLLPKRKCHSKAHRLGGGGRVFKWKRSKFLKCLSLSSTPFPHFHTHRHSPTPSGFWSPFPKDLASHCLPVVPSLGQGWIEAICPL